MRQWQTLILVRKDPKARVVATGDICELSACSPLRLSCIRIAKSVLTLRRSDFHDYVCRQ